MTPNELDLIFWIPDYSAKFHQNQARIATVGGWTDKQTEVKTYTPSSAEVTIKSATEMYKSVEVCLSKCYKLTY